MPKLKRQDVFNKVWQHAVVEGNEPSYDFNEDNCFYRGPNGESCFVGVCIPDEVYRPDMEHNNADSLVLNFPEVEKLFDKRSANTDFLNSLQYVHDGAGGMEEPDEGWEEFWRDKLSVFAEKKNLTIPDAKATTAQS